MNRILTLFLCLFASACSFAQSYLLPSRPHVDSTLAPFFHGVASGDPLTDRVIIWTRVTTADPTVSVDWQIATDTLFAQIVNSGTVTTDTSLDHTVKVDATGLQAGKWYYYRFHAYGKYSAYGRTRTASTGNTDSLRFVILACSNYEAGYFNAYKDIANRNDIDAVLHLGDYYYEYEQGRSAFFGDSMHLHEPAHEILTLADYRMRHSQYKLDRDLRYCHQQYPFITIWDDHETANDSWHDGAENHQPATEGDWYTRKDAAKKAYFEWLPIREIAAGNDTIIHRTEHWGDLLDLVMIDTRYEGRDSSLGTLISATGAYLNDTARHMLGNEQLTWFKGQLSNSAAKWKVIGNQVMIAPLKANIPLLGTRILNGDQWDGYPAERKRVLDYIMQNQIQDVVFLTGDIHCSWGNDIPHPDSTYSASTGRGSVATEFVCTSVTSPTSDYLSGVPLSLIQAADPHVKYAELSKRGYLLLDVNKQRVQGDWILLNTVTSQNYIASDTAQWMNLDTERFLRRAPAKLGSRPGNPPLTQMVTGVADVVAPLVILGMYPNPAEKDVSIQYYLQSPSQVQLTITDMTGRQVYSAATAQQRYGLFDTRVDVSQLAAGSYVVSLTAGGQTVGRQIQKVH